MRSLRRQALFKLFAPKRKSRGTMWASLLGIGLGAAFYGVSRGKTRNITQPLQNAVKNFSSKTNLNLMNNAAITEFSEELLESALRDKR